ncbi:MAG: hypothetical protein HYT39_00645 [Candidatus Sungbacteria bacterium]|nr:hypothetical protein [Candidatus Sungbacteria bacterium]
MTENPKENIPTLEEELKAFRNEIQELKREELTKKEMRDAETVEKGKSDISYNLHFDKIEPRFLNRQDMAAYQSISLLTPEQFTGLRDERTDSFDAKKIKQSDEYRAEFEAVDMFWQYLSNILFVYHGRRRLYEGREKEREAGNL